MHGDMDDKVTEGLKTTLAMDGKILKCKIESDYSRQTTLKKIKPAELRVDTKLRLSKKQVGALWFFCATNI